MYEWISQGINQCMNEQKIEWMDLLFHKYSAGVLNMSRFWSVLALLGPWSPREGPTGNHKPSLLFSCSSSALDDSVCTDRLALHCNKREPVTQGQYVVSDTHSPALFDFVSEWKGGGEAGGRPWKGNSAVEHIGTFIHSSVLPPIHDLRPLWADLKSGRDDKSPVRGLTG